MVFRAALASLFVVAAAVASSQPLSVLHIKVTLVAATRGATPVPRHALLISDNPATSSPRRVVTGLDGTVDVRLRPGNYTIESDEAVSFEGRGYQWTQTVDLVAGSDLLVELTAANAEVGSAPATTATAATDMDSSLLLPHWKNSIVSVWTTTSRSSGFVVDAAGLVMTAQRGIGTAETAEVQLTPSLKVRGRVLAADRAKDAAVIWIDSSLTPAAQVLPLGCGAASKPAIEERMKVVALGWPMREPVDLSIGEVVRIEPRARIGDFRLATGGTGGPVFNAAGALVGLSSIVEDADERRRRDTRIVPLDDVCVVMEGAQKAMSRAQRPDGARLPTEPTVAFPPAGTASTASTGATDLRSYQMSSSEFDVTFLTPPVIRISRSGIPPAGTRGGAASRGPELGQAKVDVTDFGDWTDYFTEFPPLVAVRVTPRLTESFWTTIARGAAYTQGVALPPIKHFKPGFSRLRAFCGDVEVTPVHPFALEQRVSETDAVREGLYLFEPQAFGPHCGSVSLRLVSEKAPGKEETRQVDPKIVERIWQDFAPYRNLISRSDGRQ